MKRLIKVVAIREETVMLSKIVLGIKWPILMWQILNILLMVH